MTQSLMLLNFFRSEGDRIKMLQSQTEEVCVIKLSYARAAVVSELIIYIAHGVFIAAT